MSESWARLITKVGVPSLLALWFAYSLQNDIKVGLGVMGAEVTNTRAKVEAHATDGDQLQRSINVLINLQLQQCVNASSNASERDQCFQALYRAPQR